jgi:hypothetical protein
MGKWAKLCAGAVCATSIVLGPTVWPAMADPGTHRVLETNMRDGAPPSPDPSDANWYREDTRVGGGVTLTTNFGAPTGLGSGSVAFTTNSQNSAKAQLIGYDDVNGLPLSDVTGLDYWTYHSSVTDDQGGIDTAEPSYQLRIDPDGDPSTDNTTNLVYEPYFNDEPTDGPSPQQPIAPNTWQHWDATDGLWWSSKQITCGAFSVAPGGGGAPFTQPSEVATNCTGAKVVAIGLNIGSTNPNYIVAADGLQLTTSSASYLFDFGPGPK